LNKRIEEAKQELKKQQEKEALEREELSKQSKEFFESQQVLIKQNELLDKEKTDGIQERKQKLQLLEEKYKKRLKYIVGQLREIYPIKQTVTTQESFWTIAGLAIHKK
jgi:predicted RND superfamily exporter protein